MEETTQILAFQTLRALLIFFNTSATDKTIKKDTSLFDFTVKVIFSKSTIYLENV
jgi:hypothetical protein